MQIQTTRHNTYTYLRQTNEIVNNGEDKESYAWTFEPLKRFEAMSEVDMIVISITEQCNLRCTYCCYSGEYKNNRTHSTRSLSTSDIDDVYEFVLKNVSKRPIRIAFYGGEPLTQYHLVQYAIIQGKEQLGKDVDFSLSTNATLLTSENIDWLIAQGVKMDISIDGTANFHDVNRIDISGMGTFHKVRKAIAYIKSEYPDYIDNVRLLMVLPNISCLADLAKAWHEDGVLCDIEPASISGLAPNFAQGVEKKDYESLKIKYCNLLDEYEQHRDWLVLKAFFNEAIAYWRNRPIVEVDGEVPMSTCMPLNTKLFIDAKGQIGVCEKMSDDYRIGTISEGIDYDKANTLVAEYYTKRANRCTYCPAIRVCDLCLTAIEFTREQWNVLCHNERVYARLHLFLFCEMAERDMLSDKYVPILYTERCTLNEILREDLPTLREIFVDADTKRFLPELCETIKTDTDILQLLVTFKYYLKEGEGFLLAIRSGKLLIGFVALMEIPTNPTLFYAMHPKYRNQGYMSECLSQILSYLDSKRLCSSIATEVYTVNVHSIKLLKKCGFKEMRVDRNKAYFKRNIV